MSRVWFALGQAYARPREVRIQEQCGALEIMPGHTRTRRQWPGRYNEDRGIVRMCTVITRRFIRVTNRRKVFPRDGERIKTTGAF